MTGRLVIVGNSGFVGANLQRYFSVRYPERTVTGISSADIDLTDARQADRLAGRFGERATVVMCSGVKSNYGSNVETYLKNVAMAATVCRAISVAPVERLVFFSSIAVYGVDRNNVAITEDTPVAPDTHYGLSKYDSEVLLDLEITRHAGSSLVVLRMPTMFGPNEKIVAATPSGFLTTYRSGGTVTLYGDGSERREFLYIDDVMALVDRLAHSSYRGVLNPGTGQPVSYRDALDSISRLLGRPLTVHHRERTKPQVDKIYDIGRLRSVCPDFTATSLDEGLRRIAQVLGGVG